MYRLLFNINKGHDLNDANRFASTKSNVDRRSETGLSATAIYNFIATEEDMISFRKGDKIKDVQKSTGGWWRGNCHGVFGRFPSNHVILDFISY